MTIDPFTGEVRDGKLYGRGACDVKGGMAAMLAAFARLVRERPPGAANVVPSGYRPGSPTFAAERQRVPTMGRTR